MYLHLKAEIDSPENSKEAEENLDRALEAGARIGQVFDTLMKRDKAMGEWALLPFPRATRENDSGTIRLTRYRRRCLAQRFNLDGSRSHGLQTCSPARASRSRSSGSGGQGERGG